SGQSGAGDPFAERAVVLPADGLRLVGRHLGESDLVAGAELCQRVTVGPDDVSDLRVTADRLGVRSQNDALSAVRHLYGTRPDGFREHLAAGGPQGRPLQPDAHAVAVRRHAEASPG